MIKIYSLFHLNTSFSSVEEKDLKKLIDKCYWPLLNIIENNDYCIAVECSGKTLLDIYKLDKNWIKKLKYLISKKKCEFIGSGYTQIIGPLVPEEVSINNLKYGQRTYKSILDITPKVGLINEQAFSRSLIKIYKKYFKAVIFDWINARNNLSTLKYLKDSSPCFIEDDYKNKIPVIWSNSIAFQKFQRVVYKEIEFKKFIDYINQEKNNKYHCIYSNDAEVFNFRTNRFKAEINLVKENEWEEVKKIYEYFYNSKSHKFVTFDHLLKNIKQKTIKLSTIKNPILVKKQSKYNINRWATCGKDNLLLNTYCWRIFNIIKRKKNKEKYWKKLCLFWSSDLRTHTTKKKWFKYKKEITKCLKELKVKDKNKLFYKNEKVNLNNNKSINLSQNFITFFKNNFSVSLNIKKGLAIESMIDKNISNKSLIGTIYQGEHQNYGSSSDLFSGNFSLFRKKDLKRFSDLKLSSFSVNKLKKDIFLVKTIIKEDVYPNTIVEKYITIDLAKKTLEIVNKFKKVSSCVLRLCNITFNPKAFDKKNLLLKTHNGGNKLETFKFNLNANYGKFLENYSDLCTSSNSLGLTKGKVIIGDKKKSIQVNVDKISSSLVGMLNFQQLKNTFFLRLLFSAYEFDDTSMHLYDKEFTSKVKIQPFKKSINTFL